MPKRAVKPRSGDRPLSVDEQKRVAAAFLVNHGADGAGGDPIEVARLVGYARPSVAAEWAERIGNGESPRTAHPGRPSQVAAADVKLVGESLLADRTGVGVRRVVQRLAGDGRIEQHATETYRRALVDAGWRIAEVEREEAYTPAQKAERVAFCRRVRDKGLGSKAAFSDSKIFRGGAVYRQPGQRWRAWRAPGKPRVEPSVKAPYQAREPHTHTHTHTHTP